MTDELPIAEPSDDRVRDSRVSRTRLALAAVLIILFLLLVSLGYFIVAVVRPAGPASSAASQKSGFQWVRSIYSYGTGADQTLDTPVALDVADNGVIWVGDKQRNVIAGFNPDGSVRRVIDLSALSPKGTLYIPKALDEDGGELFVGAYTGGVVTVLSTNGEVVTRWPVKSQMFDLLVNGERVYISTQLGIDVYTRDGEKIGALIPDGPGDAQVHLPQGMAIDDQGNLYIADSMNGKVKSFTSEGKLRWSTLPGKSTAPIGSSPSTEQTQTTPMQVPVGLALDGQGRVVVSDLLAMEMFVIDPANGKVIEQYSEPGGKDGQLYYPQGLGYDRDRDWFAVADMYNKRVQIVRIPRSAANALVSGLRRSLVGPVWICSLPLILLVIAIIVIATSRRRRDEDEGEGEEQSA